MFSLTSLVVFVASIAILANGFILEVNHNGRMINNARVSLSENGALYLDHDHSTAPTDFEFDKDELIVARTNKVVYVLENGECYAIERGLEPAKARSTAFSYKDGILKFNNERSYGTREKEDEVIKVVWIAQHGISTHSNLISLDLSLY